MTKNNQPEETVSLQKRIAKGAAFVLLIAFATYGIHEFLVRYTTKATSAVTVMYDALTAVFVSLLLYVLFDK